MKHNSLKQAIQGMIPETLGITIGVVIEEKPVKIQVVNNPKMILSGGNLIIPKHLTDYTVLMTVDHSTEDSNLHSHAYKGKKEFLVHGSLKKGEEVIMLRLNGGEVYIVLDRKVI